MPSNKQKLELTWIGKENRPRLEPRVLVEVPEKSYHAPFRVKMGSHEAPASAQGFGGQATKGTKGSQESNLRAFAPSREDDPGDLFDNLLIHGDNLLALKALEQEYAGKVKCVFIDPPYNTGSAFEHYDDGLEHSIWLSMMRERIAQLSCLMAPEGSIWVTLDDNEAHYFRVMVDEIFGRSNFVADVSWQKKYSPGNNQKGLSSDHDHILIWAKNFDLWEWNLLPRSAKQDAAYKNPDNDPRGLWKPSDLTRSEHRDRDFYAIITPSGKEVFPASGRSWSRPPEEIERLRADNRLWFGPRGDAKPSLKRFISEVQEGVVARTVWLRGDVGDNEEAKKEAKSFNSKEIFGTPKPERLIERILTIATNPGDLVLDSFLGSGTTAAVAHKMGRRWIGIELGDHCETHCLPRLKKVVDGEDPGGITKAVGWKGGGGFRTYRLAPSLIKEDQWGNPVINPDFQPELLSEAVCKLEGFTYAPSAEHYWRHGQASETDFIYVTTQTLSRPQLEELSAAVGPGRSLLVCCSAFRVKPDAFENLTLKKIPKAVLHRCEWNRDDYSLEIKNLPEKPPEPGQQEMEL